MEPNDAMFAMEQEMYNKFLMKTGFCKKRKCLLTDNLNVFIMRINYFVKQEFVTGKAKVVVMLFFLFYVQNAFTQGLADLFLEGIAAMQEQEEQLGNIVVIPVKDGVSIEMVKVEAGTFKMGATPEMRSPLANEKPIHRVTLTHAYYIGKYEVTQALWRAVMGKKFSYFEGDNLPQETISWDDCQEFICKLNSMTGKHFRLPTEAEWEYAARGGKKSKGYQYCGSNRLSDVAWHKGNSNGKTHPVGSKKANELGIYDMSGNVAEWCQDSYVRYPTIPQKNPIGTTNGRKRVYRGGCWYEDVRGCRSSSRFWCFSGDLNWGIGLRLVLED